MLVAGGAETGGRSIVSPGRSFKGMSKTPVRRMRSSPPTKTTPTRTIRRSRRLAHADVTTEDTIELKDLVDGGALKHLEEISYKGQTGIITNDGWIEYGTDKVPTLMAFIIAVRYEVHFGITVEEC